MLVETNHAGAVVISETIGDQLVTRSYYGYGVSEARDAFAVELPEVRPERAVHDPETRRRRRKPAELI